MSDEQWLREGLASAVPEPPANPDRARAAEHLARRRRRTTALAVVGTAGAVAAVAMLTATLADGGGGGAPDRPAAAQQDGIVVCPPARTGEDGVVPPSAIDDVDPDAPAAVPEGATSARLCQGPGTTFQVPADALTTDVDELVTAINDHETTGEPDICTSDLGPGFRIVLGYDDGSSFVTSGQLYGCQTLVVGSGYRADPERAQEEFLSLLQAQRDVSEPPAGADEGELICDGGAPLLRTRVSDITRALVCVTGGRTPWSVTIPPDDLEALLADMDANAREVDGFPDCYRDAPLISAVTAWGDRIAIGYQCSAYSLPDGRAWVPSEASQAIIDRLASGARRPPDSGGDGSSADHVVACPDAPTFDYDGIDDIQEGLPESVPEGATSVRLCAGGSMGGTAEPDDALTADVATLVEAVNALPSGVEGACTDELGPGYRLAFGYPDGSRFLVVGKFYGCDYVVVGSGYRDDPQVPLDTFVELLRAQRADQAAPYGVGDLEPPRCDEVRADPTSAVADPTQMVDARLCIGRADFRIPADDLPALIEDLRAHQGNETTGACRAIPTEIVGVTQWGDPFSLHSECGTDSYRLPGSEPRYWNTSRELELLLEDLIAAD